MTSETAENFPDSSIPVTLLNQLQSSRPTGAREKEPKKPNNAWNYRGQRKRLSHLVKHPPSQNSQMGTRDISFIYDGNNQTDKAAPLDSGETLIPANYHIVRSKHVAGLETHHSQHTTQLHDLDKQMRVFPSLQPNRRFEAVQLNRTMDAMLKELETEKTDTGPSQVHNLIEIVKKEQNIYDSIFYELIRQVTVECKERGELLSKLRYHYADLLGRVPRQINSLHCEVIAQRALDNNLTQELLHFKREIQLLTDELSVVKKHDSEITGEVAKSKDELRFALQEAAKNSSVLAEYHHLYELQRQRLEKQISTLTLERDIWNSTAYSLAIKLIEENDLTISRRLYVCERAWSKMANHLTVFLTERDSNDLKDLQAEVESWRDNAIIFHKLTESINANLRHQMAEIEQEFQKWVKKLTNQFIFTDFAGSRRMHIPDQGIVDDIIDDIEVIKNKIEKFLATFEDSDSIQCHVILKKMSQIVENWTDKAIEVYTRHRSIEGKRFPQHEVMGSINEVVHKMQEQLQLISTGENGINNRCAQVMTNISGWKGRLLEKISEVDENDWLNFVDTFELHASTALDVHVEYIGSVKGLEDPAFEDISLLDTVKEVGSWMTNTVDGIESENGKFSRMVALLKNDLLTWMSSCLLLLVPDKSNNKLLRNITNPTTVTAIDMVSEQTPLAQRCLDLTEYITKCTHGIVTEKVASLSDEEKAGVTLLDQLQSFHKESLEWETASQFMAEALQKISAEELARISQTLDESGKIDTIKHELDEAAGHFAQDLYIVGNNENITSRGVERPEKDKLTNPMTDISDEALTTLNTVEELQGELLKTEDRAIQAEQNVEELESRIRELERLLSRGEKLPEKEPEPVEPATKEPEKKVVIEIPPPEPNPPPTRTAPSNLSLPGSTGRPGSNNRRISKRGKKR